MFRLTSTIALLLLAAACGGSSTDAGPTRYNFAIIDGKNQISTAGDPTLSKPVTSQLTRDANGKFASGVLDFLLPAKAFAQSITLPGAPVANAIVCGRESLPGEPKVQPLCAYTLADGKAANTIQGGTKAGTYKIIFTVQLPTQMPVMDSTTVVVTAASASKVTLAQGTSYPSRDNPATFPADIVVDQYGNIVPFKIVVDAVPTGLKALSATWNMTGFSAPKSFAHAAGDTLGTVAARTIVVDSTGPIIVPGDDPPIILGTIQIVTAEGVVAKGSIQTRVGFKADGKTWNFATVGIGPLGGF